MQQKENVNDRLHQTARMGFTDNRASGKVRDYALKSYKLEQNTLFKKENDDEEPQYELLHPHNHIGNSDVQDEFVIVPLQITAVTTEEKVQAQKLQDQPIFIFDDQEEQNDKDINKAKENDTPDKKPTKSAQNSQRFAQDQLQDNKDSSKQISQQQITTTNNPNSIIHNQKQFFYGLNQLVNKQKRQQGINHLQGAVLRTDPMNSKQYISVNNRKIFTLSPLPPNLTLKFIIRRNASIINMISPQFDLYLANGFDYVLTSKRYPFCNRQLFKFSPNPSSFNESNLLAIMHANENHNVYWLLDQPHRIKQLDLSILYLAVHYQIIRQEESQRKFTVLVPSEESDFKLAMEYQDTSVQFCTLKQEITTRLTNLQTWKDQSLNSTKNFVLANPNNQEHHYLQMKKESENSFQLTISHPLSPLQGMAIAMTRFDVDLK